MDGRGVGMAKNARWVEGLDWIRVENILDPDFGGSPRLYSALLAAMLNYLPDADPELDDRLHSEIKRRIETQEMPYEQVMCVVEALRRSAEEMGETAAAMEKILRRGRLRVVK
jgi:hypothetical protein